MSKAYPFWQPKPIDPKEEAADRANEKRIMDGLKAKGGYTKHKGIATKAAIFAQRVYNEKMTAALDDR